MKATKINREEQDLVVTWDDGHLSRFPLTLLRDECPCAGCKGENILGTVYAPVLMPIFKPGKYELEALTPTGLYGVQAKWKDGHDTGIYSWGYLRALCPCDECSKVSPQSLKDSPEEQALNKTPASGGPQITKA